MLDTNLLVSCKLNGYFADSTRQAKALLSQLVKQIAEREVVTEKLKARESMRWMQAMNNIREQAEEAVKQECMYC